MPTYCCGVRAVPLVNKTKGTPRDFSRLLISRAPENRFRPRLVLSPRTTVPSMSKMKACELRSLLSAAAECAEDVAFAADLGINGPAVARAVQRQPKSRLFNDERRSRRAFLQFAQQSENRLHVRIVASAGRAGGEHRVHFPGRHGRA